jgi:5'-nucleotidase
MKNIIIPDKERLEKVKKDIQRQGPEKIYILTDFDRTLTYAKSIEGKYIPSIISILRDENYLKKGYAEKAHALFDKYHPIEINLHIPIKERKTAMQEWWASHNKLLLKSGLNKKDLKKIVESGVIRLRRGLREMFKKTHQKNIPLIIMSSSGVGNTIPKILEKEQILYNNIHIITNKFTWDNEGNAIKTPEKIIHCMNKDETAIQNYPKIYKKIKNRKNIILIGDSLGDLGMTTKFEYNNLIKIGFLNPGKEKNLEKYKKNFDIIIKDDGDFSEINKLIKEITR